MNRAAELAEVLRANGLTDRPDLYDGDIHSWRCSYPDRYGPCGCFQDLVADLAVRDRVVAATAAETALRDAADGVDGECPGVGAALPHPWMAITRSWLTDRADSLAAAANPDEEYQP